MGHIDHGVQGVLCGTTCFQVVHPLEVLSSQSDQDSSFSSNVSSESPPVVSVSAVHLQGIVHERVNDRHPTRVRKHVHQRLLPIQISFHSETRLTINRVQCMELHLKRRLDWTMQGFVQLGRSLLFPG